MKRIFARIGRAYEAMWNDFFAIPWAPFVLLLALISGQCNRINRLQDRVKKLEQREGGGIR